MATIAWATKNVDDDTHAWTPVIHEARVQALDYETWIMFRCAQQGSCFPLDGESSEPFVEVKKPTTTYRKNKIGDLLPAKRTALDVILFSAHLQQTVDEGIRLFIGNIGATPVVFYNESLPGYLTRDGIESSLLVLKYYAYASMEIKAMAENKDEWDNGDWDAYEKEYARLLAEGEIEEDEDSYEPQQEVDDLNRGLGVHLKDYGTDCIDTIRRCLISVTDVYDVAAIQTASVTIVIIPNEGTDRTALLRTILECLPKEYKPDLTTTNLRPSVVGDTINIRPDWKDTLLGGKGPPMDIELPVDSSGNRCKSKTLQGKPCRNKTRNEDERCWRHRYTGFSDEATARKD